MLSPVSINTHHTLYYAKTKYYVIYDNLYGFNLTGCNSLYCISLLLHFTHLSQGHWILFQMLSHIHDVLELKYGNGVELQRYESSHMIRWHMYIVYARLDVHVPSAITSLKATVDCKSLDSRDLELRNFDPRS